MKPVQGLSMRFPPPAKLLGMRLHIERHPGESDTRCRPGRIVGNCLSLFGGDESRRAIVMTAPVLIIGVRNLSPLLGPYRPTDNRIEARIGNLLWIKRIVMEASRTIFLRKLEIEETLDNHIKADPILLAFGDETRRHRVVNTPGRCQADAQQKTRIEGSVV